MVESLPSKQMVAGSSPVSRSEKRPFVMNGLFFCLCSGQLFTFAGKSFIMTHPWAALNPLLKHQFTTSGGLQVADVLLFW